jgi:hypothetical protein
MSQTLQARQHDLQHPFQRRETADSREGEMKPTVTNCFPCWTEDQRATPATWACGDEFYCDAHLRAEGIDVAKCETIEAWRASHGQPVHTPEVDQVRERQAAAGRKNGKAKEGICACGKEQGHRGRHRGNGIAANSSVPANGKRGATAASNSGRATGPTSIPSSQNPSNRVSGVPGFDLKIMSLQEYRDTMPARIQQDVLEPVVAFVKGMKPGQVVLVPPSKGLTLIKFRNRICRALQIRNKVSVTIEMRQKHNIVAVIRREERAR